jgi:hypothetical protein
LVASVRVATARKTASKTAIVFITGVPFKWLGLIRRTRSVIHQSRAGDPVPSRFRDQAGKRSRRPFKAVTA